MGMPRTSESNNGEERLPFDPWAIATGVRKRRYLLIAWAALSAVAGVAGGLAFGTQTWESHCVLMHQPPPAELSGGVYEPPAVDTQLNLVKLRPNLVETRLQLGLACSLETLGAACDVSSPRDTQLLIFRVRWDSPELAAATANTLADVFLDAQRRVRQEELIEARKYLQRRRTEVEGKLLAAQQSRQQETTTNSLEPEDLEREIRSCQTKIDALDVIYEKSLSEKQSLETQITKVNGIMEEVKRKIAEEQEESAAVEGLSNLNIRVERIREAIMDDRANRVNEISLKQWADRLAYDKKLFERGYLSKVQYDAEVAQYEKLKAQAVDTEQVSQWKQELDELYAKIRPSNDTTTASAPILRDLMLRSYNLQLAYSGVAEEIEKTKSAKDEASTRLETLVRSRGTSSTNGWQIDAWRDEIRDTDNALAKIVALQDSTTSDFQVISKAEVPPRPAKSQRRLLALAIAGLLVILGVGLVLGLELLDTRIKTPAELGLKTSEPIIGIVPNGADESLWQSDGKSSPTLEAMRLTARHVRSAASKGTKRILVTGADAGVGRTTVTAYLAYCLGQQGQKVTVVGGDIRGEDCHPGVQEVLGVDDSHGPSVGQLLLQPELSVERSPHPTPCPNVTVLPAGDEGLSPDVLGSEHMGTLLDEVSTTADLVLIDGPTTLPYADASLLAEHCDAVLLVVRSRRCRARELRESLSRLKETGVPIVGMVLNSVDRLDLGSARSLLPA
jgi:Mrp family chromosome partitioning ATPase